MFINYIQVPYKVTKVSLNCFSWLIKRLIAQNPPVLEDIDSTPFVQTPLHVAACAGHVQFATEIMILKPSFVWKFNPQGCRPVHLALENGHTTMVLHFI